MSTVKKIAFIDRDGVINKKAAEHCYITKVEDFIFNEGIFEVLKKLQEEGFEFIVITNQRGIARGLYSEEDLARIHEYMLHSFNERGITILDVLYCPHDNGMCECRKPKDGMLRQACEAYSVNLEESILISDTSDDVEMGKKFGVSRNFLVPFDHPEHFFSEWKKEKNEPAQQFQQFKLS